MNSSAAFNALGGQDISLETLPAMLGLDTASLEAWLEKITAALLVVLIPLLVVAVVFYVLRSLALHKICKRRRIRGRALCWLPVLWVYSFGAVASRHDKKAGGYKCRWGVTLLVLPAVWIALFLLAFVLVKNAGAVLNLGAVTGAASMTDSLAALQTLDFSGFRAALAASAAAGFAMTAFKTCFTVVLYKVTESCAPKAAVLWTVLCTLFPFLLPFVLIGVSGRDSKADRPKSN